MRVLTGRRLASREDADRARFKGKTKWREPFKVRMKEKFLIVVWLREFRRKYDMG